MPETSFQEWIGGRFPAPMTVGGGDEPFRPDVSLWLGAGGFIVGMDLHAPGERFAPTVALLRQSMDKPLKGPPGRPARVRVADAELANAIRAECGSQIDVVVGPTPELDEAMASMREYFGAERREVPGYLDAEGVTAEVMGPFYRAAARLFRAAPWEHVPGDEDLLTVDIEALGVRGQVLSTIGRMRENFGFVLFPSRADFERFVVESEHAQRIGTSPELPAYLSLNYERKADVPPRMRKEAIAHGWEVAGRNAHPVVLAMRGTVPIEPSPRQLAIVEAICNALADLLAADPQLGDAWDEGRGLDRTFAVNAGGQRLQVHLSVAARARPQAPVPGVFDIHAEKRDEDGAIDEAWAEDFERELLERFAAAPEASGVPTDEQWMRPVLAFGRAYFDVMVGQIGARELREILLEIFPGKMSCEPTCATGIVNELRAFWRFARRAFQLETADECLAVLRPGVELVLQRELANPARFGMAKSMFMDAAAAGFDLTDPESREAWMAGVNAGRLPSPLVSALDEGAAFGSRDRRAEKERKKKRKAKRVARKRSR